jgi:uncharacterized protein
MKAPSTAALLVLAGLCLEQPLCLAQVQNDPHKNPNTKDREKYKAACPAYEHYSRFPQYAAVFTWLSWRYS